MRVLELIGLDTRRLEAACRKVVQALEADDFAAAQVRKLGAFPAGKLYRARLNDADRLLFALWRHGGETVALLLEVIRNHDYAGSRFLRGALVDERQLPAQDSPPPAAELPALRYLHPQHTQVHLLDKPISFDDAQQAVYRLNPPLIVVGSAGSGKTALTLEKLKDAAGEVLYVTQSPYLAQSARDLYRANGFVRDDQQAQFLSLRELVEELRIPPGREAGWPDFSAWFARVRQGFKGLDAHAVFEEIRGVITADAAGPLGREAYLALGIRQSIYGAEQRESVFALYQRYRQWLAEAQLFDLNLVAFEALALATPRYDFIVVDEVQDLTPVQLALVLALRKPGTAFMLCGDSNQIVHPNFFAWGRVKTMFWGDATLAERQTLQVLAANYRNSAQATAVANTLLKIKQLRFGSIDRESNHLVQAVGAEAGEVRLLPDREAALRELDGKTRQSTAFAVVVLRDEDKPAARRVFNTPLLFSVHEAKGLEYDNIVLWRFVSDHRAEFAEVCDGVDAPALAAPELRYSRARDKADRALEIYKFYVNALYVGLTRAVKNLYLVESDGGHPLLALLGITEGGVLNIQARAASRDDWQREARRLELQGKAEQAAAIRRDLLHTAQPPWTVHDEPGLQAALDKVFIERAPGQKQRQQLYEFAACHQLEGLAYWLETEGQFLPARQYKAQQAGLARKHLAPYAQRLIGDVLRQCSQYGLEHRTTMGLTPLMAAVAAGNVALVEALIGLGANLRATDLFGRQAVHVALAQAAVDAAYARGPLVAMFPLIAPATVDLRVADRLVRIDTAQSEYLLLQTLWALFKQRFFAGRGPAGAVDTATLLAAWQHLPAQVLPERRRQRAFLSGVLARNEVDRDQPHNRQLFRRAAHGFYWLNPQLAVRTADGEGWQPLLASFSLPLLKEISPEWRWSGLDELAALAGLAVPAVPKAALRAVAKFKAEQQAAQAERERRQRELEQLLKESEALRQRHLAARSAAPGWGSVAARRAETQRVGLVIAENAARRAAELAAKAQADTQPAPPSADDPPPG